MSIQPILKQLREAEKVATKGEWQRFGDGHKERVVNGDGEGFIMYPEEGESTELNASLIVLMRNNLIPLLDYVEATERRVLEWARDTAEIEPIINAINARLEKI